MLKSCASTVNAVAIARIRRNAKAGVVSASGQRARETVSLVQRRRTRSGAARDAIHPTRPEQSAQAKINARGTAAGRKCRR